MNKAELLQEAIEQIKAIGGYRVLKAPGTSWFYVITPKGNVLYVQRECFDRGFNVTFKYKPYAPTGSGCDATNKTPIKEFTREILEQCEWRGFSFARSLGARFYSSYVEWMRHDLWHREQYVEVA